MKLTIGKRDLQELLQRCQSIVPARGTMSILSYVLLSAEPEGVYLTATDLEVVLRVFAPAKVIQPGKAALLARKMFEIVRELPEAEVQLAVEDNSVKISCGVAEFVLSTLPADDFPPLPSWKEEELFPLNSNLLSDMIRKTIFAVPTTETRQTMTGALLELAGSSISMVGTDGHRLAIMAAELSAAGRNASVILPKKVVAELKKLADEAVEPLQCGFLKNMAVFVTSKAVLVGRLIEGNYPNYKQVIPSSTCRSAIIPKENLYGALRRVSLLSDERSHTVKLELTSDKLFLYSQDSEIGDAHDELPITLTGEEISVGFNASYVLEALDAIDEAEVRLEMNEPLGACLFTPVKKSSQDENTGEQPTDEQPDKEQRRYVCLIMPLKVN